MGFIVRFILMSVLLLALVPVIFFQPIVAVVGGGKTTGNPAQLKAALAPQQLVALDDIFTLEAPIVDQHLHLLAHNTPIKEIFAEFCPALTSAYGNTKAWINPGRFQIRHPLQYVKSKVLMSTLRVANKDIIDLASLDYLLQQVKSLTMPDPQGNPGYNLKIHLLAVDGHYAKGATTFDPNLTDMMIPSIYAIEIARCLNSQFESQQPFVPVISVNPYKATALAELDSFKDQARYMKWVAPAMGFDPMDPDIGPYLDKIKDYGMVILSHTGGEHAFEVHDDRYRQYGDPFHARQALDKGIPVILSHAGGDDDDSSRRYENNRHFMQLLSDERNQNDWCLFGDTSALSMEKNFQHFDLWFDTVAVRPFQYRMLYGSDYPLPATAFLYPIDSLTENQQKNSGVYLQNDQTKLLADIFTYNPLAFDIALKRLLRRHGAGDAQLAPEMFMSMEENIRREMMDTTNPMDRLQCHRWYQQFVELN